MTKIASALGRGGILAALATLLVLTTIMVAAAPGEAKKKKPVNADTLDGKDSTEFLGKGEKAADSDLLDGKDSGEFQSKVMWAVVKSDGTLERSSGSGITSEKLDGGTATGSYYVEFPQSIASCSYQGTLKFGPGEIAVERYSPFNDKALGPVTFNSSGQFEDRSFQVAAIC